jgi:hypothetical protein
MSSTDESGAFSGAFSPTETGLTDVESHDGSASHMPGQAELVLPGSRSSSTPIAIDTIRFVTMCA